MNLYIVRHAIAEQRDGHSSEDEDSQRPLTDAGRKKFRQIARGLGRLGTQVDLILTSPYLRAADTARILQEKLDLEKDKLVIMDDLSPVGDPDRLIKNIGDQYGSTENIALVGHEPGLSRLISVLLSGDPTLPITMKKGGICCLSVETLEYGRCATLEWLLAPAPLTRIGP
jgi:phosphohistidine phosphatase